MVFFDEETRESLTNRTRDVLNLAMHCFEAPCKINLNLRIVGKRDDGFHEVDTLMAPLSLADRLEFEPISHGVELVCDTPGVPLDESNLVIKAIRVMERELGRDLSYRVRLVKNVPHGAGLGGGSSDAASTLLAVNQLEKAGLSQEHLIKLAAELGSDIGFFLGGGICRCTGRGEKVQAAPEPERSFKAPILLLKPVFGVSTPDAYRRWKASKQLPNIPYDPVSWGGIEWVNDLERPVFEKFLILGEIKRWLKEQQGVKVALMSGSGSTMFAVLEDERAGEDIVQRAKQELDPTLWTWVGNCGAGVLD
jgi:4-diphosphocytidyl-2-C-methyl-D-erythritol kinase